MTESLGIAVALDLPFNAAVALVREALQQEGFGVLTEIDMQAAFKEKLKHTYRPFVILGVCNPALAYAALSADREVGLLLPCNVTIEGDGADRTVVRLVDPVRLLGASPLASSPVVTEVATDARERLQRVARALASPRSRVALV